MFGRKVIGGGVVATFSFIAYPLRVFHLLVICFMRNFSLFCR